MNTIKQRIKDFLEYKDISVSKISAELGFAKSNFSEKTIDKEIGSGILSKIMNKFPEISPDWLLTGKGEMLRCGKAPTTPLPDDNPLSHSSEKDLNALVTVIDRQSQQIERLIAIIETITNKK